MQGLVAAMAGVLIAAGIISVAPTAVGDEGTVTTSATDTRNFKRNFLPPCAGPDSMNCIESIEYLLDGEWRTGALLPHDGPDTPFTYGYGTPGLVHEAGRTAVNAGLIERDDVNGPPYAAYQFQLQAHPHGTDVLWDPPINRCENGDPGKPGTGPCWRAPWLAETDYRFTFRTNTLVPIFARSSAIGLTVSVEEIAGGRRVAVTGRPGPGQFWIDEKADRAEAITYEWEGFIADARARNGVLAECQGLGVATAYSNGNGGFMPEWDARTGSLVFGVTGLHYGPDGKVYRGRAEVLVPGPLARCIWRVDPRQTARMEVEVYTENGEESAGTKSIAYDDKADLVKMIAIDFTYSEKQIAARPTPIDAKPGKKACDVTNTVCVTVDRARKSAKVSVAKVMGASEVRAVALLGTREDGPQLKAPVKKGKASFTVRLPGAKSQGQVWVVRTPSTFISSFQVG